MKWLGVNFLAKWKRFNRGVPNEMEKIRNCLMIHKLVLLGLLENVFAANNGVKHVPIVSGMVS